MPAKHLLLPMITAVEISNHIFSEQQIMVKHGQGLVDENKVKGYALCMIQDPVEPNLIFVGTEQGLWVSFDNGNTFAAMEKWISFRFYL